MSSAYSLQLVRRKFTVHGEGDGLFRITEN
jgi:hypothetical protein